MATQLPQRDPFGKLPTLVRPARVASQLTEVVPKAPTESEPTDFDRAPDSTKRRMLEAVRQERETRDNQDLAAMLSAQWTVWHRDDDGAPVQKVTLYGTLDPLARPEDHAELPRGTRIDIVRERGPEGISFSISYDQLTSRAKTNPNDGHERVFAMLEPGVRPLSYDFAVTSGRDGFDHSRLAPTNAHSLAFAFKQMLSQATLEPPAFEPSDWYVWGVPLAALTSKHE